MVDELFHGDSTGGYLIRQQNSSSASLWDWINKLPWQSEQEIAIVTTCFSKIPKSPVFWHVLALEASVIHSDGLVARPKKGDC